MNRASICWKTTNRSFPMPYQPWVCRLFSTYLILWDICIMPTNMSKPSTHWQVVYRVLPWSYSLPPVDGQNDQEGLPCRCNVPILQKSYSLWSLKNNIKHLHAPNLHGCMQTEDKQKWYHLAGTRSHICWKWLRTSLPCPYMAHPPSIEFQVTKSQDGTTSKNPQGSHILGACPPSCSSQRRQTRNHFEWSAHEHSYPLQRATTLAYAFSTPTKVTEFGSTPSCCICQNAYCTWPHFMCPISSCSNWPHLEMACCWTLPKCPQCPHFA